VYNTTYPAARLGVYSPSTRKTSSKFNSNFLDSLLCLDCRMVEFEGEAKRDLSDATALTAYANAHKVTRLEFRPFSVVEQSKDDLLLPDYLAANSSLLHLHLSAYPAANSTADSISPRFLSLRDVRAAIKRSIFIDHPWPLKPILQQESVAKAFLETCQSKQNFSITPSELNSFLSCAPLTFRASREQVVALTSAGEVQ
jgi:hypothetical protein